MIQFLKWVSIISFFLALIFVGAAVYGAYTGLLSDIVIEPLETIPQELYFLGGYLAVTGLVIPFVGVLSSWRVLDRSEQDELNGLFIGSVVGNIVIFLGTFFSVGNAIITITP